MARYSHRVDIVLRGVAADEIGTDVVVPKDIKLLPRDAGVVWGKIKLAAHGLALNESAALGEEPVRAALVDQLLLDESLYGFLEFVGEISLEGISLPSLRGG